MDPSRLKRCKCDLIPSNAATNFGNPAESVRRAVARDLVAEHARVLEFGAGNLRNLRFLAAEIPSTRLAAVDLPANFDRFAKEYDWLKARSGSVFPEIPERRRFDMVIVTYALETVCPAQVRHRVLRDLRRVLVPGGSLIGSFRGHPGTRGSQYQQCPHGCGLVSPQRTFVLPQSLTECRELLNRGGFVEVQWLMRYRVESPENIHVVAL